MSLVAGWMSAACANGGSFSGAATQGGDGHSGEPASAGAPTTDTGGSKGEPDPVAGESGLPSAAGSGGAESGGAPNDSLGGGGSGETTSAGAPPVACQPMTKGEACGFTVKCGPLSDGCDGSVSCGTCGESKECDAGQCVCEVRPVATVAGACAGYCASVAPEGCGAYYKNYPDECGTMLSGSKICNTFNCFDDSTGIKWTCGNPVP